MNRVLTHLLKPALLLATALLTACSPGAPTARPSVTPSSTPTRPPTQSPTATPSPTPTTSPAGAVIVTFEVQGERYRVLVEDPQQVAIAYDLLAGKQAPSIPNGRIVRGDPDVNTGWSWHIDPADFAFADVTIELCDGLPSYVEDGSLSGDRFCPWTATVVEVVPAR